MQKKAILFLTFFITNICAHWPSIYNPDRALYMENAHNKPQSNACVFCTQLAENTDKKHFIIKRYDHAYVFLNRFPYQYGHMLIMPLRHVSNLEDLNMEEYQQLMNIVRQAISCLKKTYNVDGVNVGINLGSAAGASKPDHLHIQVLPRWYGDTGWLHTIGQTGVITHSMSDVYEKLKHAFNH